MFAMLSKPNGTPMATARIVIVRWSLASSEYVVFESVDAVNVNVIVGDSGLVVFGVVGDGDQVMICADPRPVNFELVDDRDVSVAVASADSEPAVFELIAVDVDDPAAVALWVSGATVLGVSRSVAAVFVSAELR